MAYCKYLTKYISEDICQHCKCWKDKEQYECKENCVKENLFTKG
jgi:hypothetical protein